MKSRTNDTTTIPSGGSPASNSPASNSPASNSPNAPSPASGTSTWVKKGLPLAVVLLLFLIASSPRSAGTVSGQSVSGMEAAGTKSSSEALSTFTATPSADNTATTGTTRAILSPLLADGTYDLSYIGILIAACGALCTTAPVLYNRAPGSGLAIRTVPADCEAYFGDDVFLRDGHGQPVAPKEIPSEYRAEFTLDGVMAVHEQYYDEHFVENTHDVNWWTEEAVNDLVAQARAGKLHGGYGRRETENLRFALGLTAAATIAGKRVLVIGSQKPWVEACVLEAGAAEVVTLEYGDIVSTHPKIKTMTPGVFRDRYHDGSLGLFDAVATFSSVEHSGLGRYGDALNPWGDVLEIARAWCVTKPGGSLTIAVPEDKNIDKVNWNAHRFFGKFRYPYLTTNWAATWIHPMSGMGQGQVANNFVKVGDQQ